MTSTEALKEEGWIPEYTPQLLAISELRKAVYLLSTNVKPHILHDIKRGLKIEYVDLMGHTEKELAISLFMYCQKEHLLGKLFAVIINLKLAKEDYFDHNVLGNIEKTLDVDISNLSFQIPPESTCLWKMKVRGRDQHKTQHVEKEYHLRENPCYKKVVCEICGKVLSEKEEHQPGVWRYVQDGNCNMVLRCMRCHKILETKIEHIKGDWKYVSENCCDLVIECERCGEILEKKTEHTWGGWSYVSDSSCDKVRICERCNASEKKRNQHQWSDYHVNKNGSKYRECAHCKKQEYDISNSVWEGYVTWDDGKKDLWRVNIEKKSVLLVIKKVVVLIDIEVNVSGDKYDFKVVQKSSLDVSGSSCVIEGKKIKQNSGKSEYSLVTFNGVISKDCLSIEGTVSGKNVKGELTLK